MRSGDCGRVADWLGGVEVGEGGGVVGAVDLFLVVSGRAVGFCRV